MLLSPARLWCACLLCLCCQRTISLSWVLQVWTIVCIWDFFWRLGCQLMGWLRSDPEGSLGRLTDEVIINGLVLSYGVIIQCYVWDDRNVRWQGLEKQACGGYILSWVLSPSVSLLPRSLEVSSSALFHIFLYDFAYISGPKQWGQATLGWNLWYCNPKQTFHSLSEFPNSENLSVN